MRLRRMSSRKRRRILRFEMSVRRLREIVEGCSKGPLWLGRMEVIEIVDMLRDGTISERDLIDVGGADLDRIVMVYESRISRKPK